ncbi:MAG TPA: Sec-independent protein translocase subunit TatA [Streptosporangiaceae bacterium]|jgi:sec-independent protein translocase protein TatA|nr:Sec-independent protein translocase subunit TatA [Streptosporangiaceae bacterium]
MNFGDLFDSPWKILIVAVVIIVLFGSKKLPGAARSLGQSMRILKREVQGLHEDEPASDASASTSTGFPAPAEITATQQPGQQAQIDALQQQIRDLQRAATMDAGSAPVQAGASAEAQRTQPSS